MSLDIKAISTEWSYSVTDDQPTDIAWGNNDFLLIVPPEGPNQGALMTKLFTRLHHALNGSWQGSAGSANNPYYNYDIVEGRLADMDHMDALAPYGDIGNSKLMDMGFFRPNMATMRGIVGKQPLDWSIHCLSPEVALKKLEKVARKGAEGFMREAAGRFQQQGMDVRSMLVDPHEFVPPNPQEIESMLTDKEELEETLFDLLKAALLHDKTKMKLDNTLMDRMTINYQIGEVYAESGWPRFRPLKASNTAYWGPDKLETAEDAIAWLVTDLIPAERAVRLYGMMLEKAGTYNSFINTIKAVGRRQPLPTTYRDGTLEETLFADQPINVMGQPAGGYGSYGKYYQSGPVTHILEQKIYARLTELCKVRMTLDGRDLTVEERESYDKGTMTEAPAVIIKNIDEMEFRDNKTSPAVKIIPRVRLYESVMLGDRHLVYHRPATTQFRYKNDPANVKFPIVCRRADEPSLVSMGIPLHELYVNCAMALRKRVALSGIKSIAYDVSRLPEGWDLQRVMYEAKEGGVIAFNGEMLGSNNNREGYKHLTTIDFSLSSDVQDMLNLLAALRGMFDELCGVTAGLKGQFQSREALGQTQLSLTQGSLITFKMAADHEAFVEEVLERMMKLGQSIWSRDETRTVVLGRDKVKTLKLSDEIGLYDYGMFVTSATKSADERNTILQVANQALSSGAIGLKDLLRLLRDDNPFRMLDIIETGLNSFEKQQAAAAQASAQAQQSAAEANLKKVDVPVQVAEVTGKWRLEVEKARQQFESQRAAGGIKFNEESSDINNLAKLQQMALQQQGDAQLQQQQMADPEQSGQIPSGSGADPSVVPAGLTVPAG